MKNKMLRLESLVLGTALCAAPSRAAMRGMNRSVDEIERIYVRQQG